MNKQLRIKVSLDMSTVSNHELTYNSTKIHKQNCNNNNVYEIQIEAAAEGHGMRGIPCHWNVAGPSTAGDTSFTLHPPNPMEIETEPEPVLQIGYFI